MMSIFQKTMNFMVIFALASALWASSATHCAAEADSRAVEAEAKQVSEANARRVLSPAEQLALNRSLCDQIMAMPYADNEEESEAEAREILAGIERLIEQGADVDARMPSGARPLLIAAFFGHKDKAELLLDKGADINAINKKGETALSLAVYGGHADIVALLLERGARIDIASLKGSTPLERVFFKQNRVSQAQILPILLKHAVRDEQVRDVIMAQLCGAMKESARAEVLSKAESDKMAQELIPCRQLKVVQQEYQDCGLQALANAYAIDKCVRLTGLVDEEAVKEWHAEAYERIAEYLGAQNKLRDVRMSGTGSSELMMAAKDLLGMDRCCAISLEFPRVCSTSMQSLEHLRLQLPDCSGHMIDNASMHKMFDELSECYRGSVQILGAIKTNNRNVVDAVDHWVLVSVIKEGLTIRIELRNSNNVPVEDSPPAQKLVEFIRDTYAARLLEKTLTI